MNAKQEIIEVLDFGFDVQEAIEKAKEDDGKVTGKDWPVLWPLTRSIGPAFTGLDRPREILRQLSPQDKIDILAHAKKRFDLPDDELEELVEDTIDWVVDGVELANRWIDRRKAA